MKREVVLRINRYTKKRICLACDKPIEEGKKIVRGCHEGCARAMYRAIERKEITDADQVAEGRWLAKGKRGPKPTNAVTLRAKGLVKE